MNDAEITYDQDGYALTPEGQAWKLWVSGAEPATDAHCGWFGVFSTEARENEIRARIEADAERVDQENRGIPWTATASPYLEVPYDRGPWRTWPLPSAHHDPAAHLDVEPEAEA